MWFQCYQLHTLNICLANSVTKRFLTPGGGINELMSSYQCGDSHHAYKTSVRCMYFHNGNSITVTRYIYIETPTRSTFQLPVSGNITTANCVHTAWNILQSICCVFFSLCHQNVFRFTDITQGCFHGTVSSTSEVTLTNKSKIDQDQATTNHVHISCEPWWRHQMETFSALLAICVGNSPVPVKSPNKGQWRGALVFSLICVWIDGWVNNHEAGVFETLSRPFWRHRYSYINLNKMLVAFMYSYDVTDSRFSCECV